MGWGWKRVAKAAGTSGLSEVANAFHEKNQAARDAAAKQQALATQAYNQNAFSDPSYADAEKTLMNNLVEGKTAMPTSEEVANRMTSVVPQINQNFANNAWSTGRQKALNAATLQATNDLSAQKTAMQTSALDKLREEAQNRTNTLLGKASMVQVKPTIVDNAADLIKLTGGVANTAASIKSLAI